MSKSPLFLTLCLGALASAPLSADAAPETVTSFDGADSLRWQTVNDGVMGGLSRGGFKVTSKQTLIFSGATSLENNGGFSSIRTRPQSLNLAGADGLALRVRGDGRAYKVSLRTAGTSRYIAYWAELPTVAGEWVDVRIPFGDWVPTSFGRKLPGPALKVKSINSVGFMLYDKKAGPFSLEVASIATYKGSATQPKGDAVKAGSTIVEAAQAAGSFKTLLAAAEAAGLVQALSGPGPLTVFAPTDAAFAALPEGAVASLLKPKNREQLRTVLSYHVVSGDLRLATLLKTQKVQTLAGQRLAVTRAGGALKVGAGTVLTSDLGCSNGVIHVVDRVLLPELDTLAGVAEEAGTFKTLLAAAKAAGLDKALAGSTRLTVFAPTDEAFAALPEGTVAALLEPANREALVRLLKHHILEGAVGSDQALEGGSAKTLAGTTLEFSYAEGSLRVSGAALTALDLPAANGVIHVVESVLLPAKQEPSAKAPTESSTATKRAARLIERAIDRGVPLFNDGKQESCRAIYELTATALLDLGEGLLSTEVESLLRKAIESSKQGSAYESAWELRRALDATYRYLLKA